MKRNWRTLGLAAVCTVTVAAAMPYMRRSGAVASASHGRISVQELQIRTEELCRTIDPRPGRRSVVPCATRTFHTDGVYQPIWRMDCLDADGRNIASVNWDADTGDLLYFTRQSSVDYRLGSVKISEQQSCELARIWMTKLGIAKHGARWSLAGKPRRMAYEWRSRWQSGEWSASLFIDASTGDVKLARVWKNGAKPVRA